MQIIVHIGNHPEVSPDFVNVVETLLSEKLGRFSDRITRLEVHFADENSSVKSGPDDKRCTIEARPKGMEPVAVSANAPSFMISVRGAIDKLKSLLDSTLGKQKA
jgi:ribosome-associated translation inhibitor RaiA